MNKILLPFIGLLLSSSVFGQANSINHSKRKGSISANNNSPSQSETIAWIEEKLNNYASSPFKFHMKDDTSVLELLNLNFTCHIKNDTLFYKWITSTSYFVKNKSVKIFTCINVDANGNPIYGYADNEKSVGNRIIPLKDVTNIEIIEIPHFYNNLKDTTSSGYAKELKINGINMKMDADLKGDHPNAKYRFFGVASGEIPIDFSKEPNLAGRLIKAFNHLKTFYNQPEVKPKVKNVF